ncbi:MAG: NAD(+)/NADH kinase [Candidatus Acetothermia bacterium]|nr:NAD(+)/NADH kinase [Candidatus Acetothermia bacterium]
MELSQVLFVYNPDRPAAEAVVRRGARWCEGRGIAAHLSPRWRAFPESVDLVVAVGGDGTILRAASGIYPTEIPILGVHVGSLGFLAACEGDHIEDALEEMVSGQVRAERRLRLAAGGPGIAGTALNDVVVVGPAHARYVELAVEVDGDSVAVVSGDGVIVATPTGSTAYALAAGGPIVHPGVGAILIVPLASHCLGLRPVAVPAGAEVRVQALSPAAVFLDGDMAGELAPGEAIRVARAPADTVFLRLSGEATLFARLRDKLGWPAP